ncbi:MAG: 16S rRNA (cytidine(1402)-2'-O)-methyltransferase [Terriglobia bacterium]
MSDSEVPPAPADTTAGGRLFLVATPIGNLEDISFRGIRTLKEAGLIACEDTRRTQILLDHYSIRTRVISYHEHNEMTRAPELILRMEEGTQLALVSDAGTPLISDPGYRLVRLAIRHGVPVVPIPGVSALVATLAVSGLAPEPFRFLGFLPGKRHLRLSQLRELAGAQETLVFYESPHRISETLEDVQQTFGERQVVIGREVTKMHEEFLRGTASEVVALLKKKPPKGEMTVVIGPPEPASPQVRSAASPARSIRKQMKDLMASSELSEREALKALAKSSGISRSELYRRWQVEKSSK